MYRVIISEVERHIHAGFEFQLRPAIAIERPVERMDEIYLVNRVRRAIRRHFRKLRAEGRSPCIHRGIGATGDIQVIAMYPPAALEVYDEETEVSIDAGVIPICLGCEGYGDTNNL